jgi:OOP family OmpA-OmpF porin
MFTETRRLLLVTAALSVALAGCSTAEKNMAPPPKPAPVMAPAPPPPPPPPPPPKVMAPTFVIDDVNFAYDKSELRPTATDTLDRVAGELRGQPDVHYEVAGFTDSSGSDAYNQSLSERRAGAVGDYLMGHGVDGGQLTMRGYGENNPVATNATKEGRAKNRRVEIRPRK